MKLQERQILKNLVAVCVVFGFDSLGFSSLQSLQSSLNSSKGLGLASLSCKYAAGTTSSFFLAPTLIRKLGSKKTMILGSVSYGIYAVSNFYPRFYTVIPASIICGAFASPLWAAATTYLNVLATNKAYITNEAPEILTTRYLSLLQMTWQMFYVISTFLVSHVLTNQASAEESEFLERNFSVSQCGARDCGAEIPEEAVGAVDPPLHIIQIFLGCYTACSMLFAPLVGIIFVDDIKPNYSNVSKDVKEAPEAKRSSWLGAFRALQEPHLLMLMPSVLFLGAHFSFVMGDFTKSFVSCTNGIHAIGYVIMVFASADAIFNLVLGWIRKYVGRVMVTSLCGALTMAVLVTCLVWNPETGTIWHLYVMSVAFGIGDAVWQLQTRVFISVLFPDNKGPTFSAYYFFSALGFTLSFAISIPASTCVHYKIYSLISLLFASLILYYIVEVRFRMQNSGGSKQGDIDEKMETKTTKSEKYMYFPLEPKHSTPDRNGNTPCSI